MAGDKADSSAPFPQRKRSSRGRPVPSSSLDTSSEVIVRNLAFSVEKKHLHQMFAPYGNILDVRIPTVEKNGKTLKRGFAFVRFKSKNSARTVQSKLTGAKLEGRPIVVDIALGNREYNRHVDRPERDQATKTPKERLEVPESEPDEESSENDIETTSANDQGMTDTSVRNEEIESNYTDTASDTDSNDDSDSSDSDDSDSDSDDGEIWVSASEDEEEMERESLGDGVSDAVSSDEEDDHDDDDDAVSSDDDDDGDGVSAAVSRSGHDVSESRTIFVRNVPFTATEAELEDVFRRYGSVLFAKLVVDRSTNEPRGTAFVKFRTTEAAQKVLDEETQLQRLLHQASGAKSPHALARATGKRAATVALSAPLEDVGIIFKNRRLICSPAIRPDEAVQMKEANKVKRETQREKIRFLEQFEVDLEDEKAVAGMSPADLKRRKLTWESTLKRLMNPNSIVNKKRLNVQNIPLTVDGALLREAINRCILRNRTFRRQVAKYSYDNHGAKLFEGLVKWLDENNKDLEVDVVGLKRSSMVLPREYRRLFEKTGLNAFPKLMIVRSEERGKVDEKGNKVMRSKGYGFVDGASEELTSALLVELNNDPTAFSNLKRPIVNFALEDARALRQHEKRKEVMEKRKERRAKKEAEVAAKVVEKGKGVKRALKMGRSQMKKLKRARQAQEEKQE